AADRSKLKVTKIITQPTQAAPGGFTWNLDGSFTYKPKAGWTGDDSFTYEVTDGTNTEEAKVKISRRGHYPRGNAAPDASPARMGGLLLAGGGDEGGFEDGIKWLVQHANGGDLVVLRASDDPKALTDYFWNISKDVKQLNSVKSYVITQRYDDKSPESQ